MGAVLQTANSQTLQRGCKGSSTCCILIMDLLQVRLAANAKLPGNVADGIFPVTAVPFVRTQQIQHCISSRSANLEPVLTGDQIP